MLIGSKVFHSSKEIKLKNNRHLSVISTHHYYKQTSETRAKCASNIIARKLDRTEQLLICSYLYTITLCSCNAGK